MNKDNKEAYTYEAILRKKFGDSSEGASQVRISPDSLSRNAQIALDRRELNRLIIDRAYARQQG